MKCAHVGFNLKAVMALVLRYLGTNCGLQIVIGFPSYSQVNISLGDQILPSLSQKETVQRLSYYGDGGLGVGTNRD